MEFKPPVIARADRGYNAVETPHELQPRAADVGEDQRRAEEAAVGYGEDLCNAVGRPVEKQAIAPTKKRDRDVAQGILACASIKNVRAYPYDTLLLNSGGWWLLRRSAIVGPSIDPADAPQHFFNQHKSEPRIRHYNCSLTPVFIGHEGRLKAFVESIMTEANGFAGAAYRRPKPAAPEPRLQHLSNQVAAQGLVDKSRICLLNVNDVFGYVGGRSP
jgi:hypothetical protein